MVVLNCYCRIAAAQLLHCSIAGSAELLFKQVMACGIAAAALLHSSIAVSRMWILNSCADAQANTVCGAARDLQRLSLNVVLHGCWNDVAKLLLILLNCYCRIAAAMILLNCYCRIAAAQLLHCSIAGIGYALLFKQVMACGIAGCWNSSTATKRKPPWRIQCCREWISHGTTAVSMNRDCCSVKE